MPDLDEELRAVVFAWMHQLRERHAYRIPRDELSRGVTAAMTRIGTLTVSSPLVRLDAAASDSSSELLVASVMISGG
jgi:hypothetical protein